MNKFKQTLTMVFLLTTILTYGQNSSSNNNGQPYIEVTGTAEQEIIPDEIYISIIIHERYENKIKITIEEQEEKLKEAIKAVGIELSNLFLSDANADYVRVTWRKKEVMTKKDYSLKVSDATFLGKVFEKLEDLKINDAYISKVSHSKMDSLKREIRILAIKAAKEKADYLLKIIGEQTGKALVVTENDNPNMPQRHPNMAVNTVAGLDSRSVGIPVYQIQFEKIKLTASIYVKFAIK